ncbi:Thiol-disulfide isomerase and thioredoxins [Hahella chejuensis KCTC 2396]|uniref:Thiol-disulfide isomerase and thioredoxins n=1 Tax=Hahella chejuensis (strain KCTC 2396) TaxID=349521 RepID=Q2SGY6_HAHCH|nr:TlpA disulfide reductase family protein [Hahella chejuensis]ABC30088.1 Thiol-disulfide isomerase and thioredoxins [Hahella chejuensis KCTC 2396]
MPTQFKGLMKIPLVAFLSLSAFSQSGYAEEVDYSAEGERRAKIAGESLIGAPAPKIRIKDIDGETIDLAQVYGEKPVYLKFWATWCAPCREQMQGFEEIFQKYGDKIQVVAINTGISDNQQSVTAFREKAGLTMPITIDDGELARAFQLRVTPQHVLIDKKGEFAYFGHKDDQELHQALDRVVAEKSAEKPLNNPVLTAKDNGYQVGDIVPNVSFSPIDAQPLSFKFNTPDSKKVAVVFFAPWCEWYLEKTEPKTSKACTQVRELLESQSKQSDVQWVTVSTNLWSSPADLKDYRANYGASMPIVFDEDGKLFKQFGVNQVPTIAVIEPDGIVSLKSSIQDDDFDAALKTIANFK